MINPNPTARGRGVRNQPSETIGAPFRLGYRPALDGFRGVAILLVVLTHLDVLGENYGFIGVDMFFVLSGFLITCLLLQEWDQNRTISLKAFYARRALRLLPALTALLCAFLVFSWFCHSQEQRLADVKETLLALFYSMNWAVALDRFQPKILSHTWSLCIEEQFYLIWPAVLLLLLRRCTRTSLCNFTALGVVIFWLVRFLLCSGTAAGFMRLSRGLDTRADALLMGCLLGMLIASGLIRNPARWGRMLQLGAAAAFILLGLIGHFFTDADESMYMAGWFFMSFFSAFIILELVRGASGVFNCIFDNPISVYLGRISYGLYLWHWPVIMALKEFHSEWVHSRITSIMLTAVVTLSSYYLLELPCLRMKRHFQKVS